MKILFVHQNFPGQFVHLAPELARRGHEVAVLTDEANDRPSALRTWRYRHKAPAVDPAATRLGRNYTTMSDRGVSVARAARLLRDQFGWSPDLVIGHSGWGETLFLKEVWPQAKLLVYAEFHYMGHGADVGFDPEFSRDSFEGALIAQGRAAHLTQALAVADAGLAPTRWQKDSFPKSLRPMIHQIFDGVDTDVLAPRVGASLRLPSGQVLRPGDEVLTFVNRNLEPYRGYHIMMRALPDLMAARPEAQVVMIGGDGVSYGQAPASGSWKQRFLDEVGGRIDRSRLHFLGKVPYADYVSLLHVSRVHAYLTYPFVLSWSAIEALAAGCLVVGSRTAPVEEVISHGENGLLVDFFDIKAWSQTLSECLAQPERFAALRLEARRRAIATYDLQRHCLPAQLALVERLLAES